MKTIRNLKLYEYIVENYIEAEKPVTQKQIAEEFGMSIGAIKNFMYRHNLNKKKHYDKIRQEIAELSNKNISAKHICKILNLSPQNFYTYKRKIEESCANTK